MCVFSLCLGCFLECDRAYVLFFFQAEAGIRDGERSGGLGDGYKSQIRYGLRPGSVSSCRQWKPPYVCLADSPSLAWGLIGRFRPSIRDWDLWWTTGAAAYPFETIPWDDGEVREYRVYHRIFKRDLWFVGSRINEHFREVS